MKKIASYLIIAALAIALGVAGCSKKQGSEAGKGEAGKAAPAAGEKAAPAAAAGSSELAKFADDLCSSAKKGSKDFMMKFSPEFSIRTTITPEQLKAMNMTIEQMVAEQVKQMQAVPVSEDKKAGECTVGETKDMTCDEMYKLIETKMPGTPFTAAKMTEIGKTMNIEACGSIELSIAEAGKPAEKGTLAVGKAKGNWVALMPLMDHPAPGAHGGGEPGAGAPAPAPGK